MGQADRDIGPLGRSDRAAVGAVHSDGGDAGVAILASPGSSANALAQ